MFAICDMLSELVDLFLIRPPEGASHQPVNPAHVVVAGDSAGGGLTLALLQVLRDCGLPMPAGAVLISPWCDLTHSFPSIHTNTPTVSCTVLIARRAPTDQYHHLGRHPAVRIVIL